MNIKNQLNRYLVKREQVNLLSYHYQIWLKATRINLNRRDLGSDNRAIIDFLENQP
jgi:hypothetical protein